MKTQVNEWCWCYVCAFVSVCVGQGSVLTSLLLSSSSSFVCRLCVLPPPLLLLAPLPSYQQHFGSSLSARRTSWRLRRPAASAVSRCSWTSPGGKGGLQERIMITQRKNKAICQRWQAWQRSWRQGRPPRLVTKLSRGSYNVYSIVSEDAAERR